MRERTAKVTAGKIADGDDLQEGSSGASDLLEPRRPILTPEDEQELTEALAEIRAGDFVDGEQLLADLKARGQRR